MKLEWEKLTYVLTAVSIGLPALLVFHGVFSAREIREMQSVFLRDRAATIAARVEKVPPRELRESQFEELFESDSALLGIHVYLAGQLDSGENALRAIREGRELYRTEEIRAAGTDVFRAYIPFHSEGQIHVARIDLSPAAPDFLLVHARHNLEIAVVSGTVLLLVSLTAIWSLRRAARLERRKLETDRLAELGSLSAVLAHEIRNPLGAVKGFAQLAAEDAGNNQRKLLDSIVRECGRLEALVNDLLLYGRPFAPDIHRIEWHPLESELAAYAQQAIGGRPIEFRSESDVAALKTDGGLLKQALLNLIRNSLESIPDGRTGTVRLRVAAKAEHEVKISVEDDGPGLPEAVRAKLFSPFVTTKVAGSGLGLAISKKIAESLGGTLRVSGVTPHGTRAELYFHGIDSGH